MRALFLSALLLGAGCDDYLYCDGVVDTTASWSADDELPRVHSIATSERATAVIWNRALTVVPDNGAPVTHQLDDALALPVVVMTPDGRGMLVTRNVEAWPLDESYSIGAPISIDAAAEHGSVRGAYDGAAFVIAYTRVDTVWFARVSPEGAIVTPPTPLGGRRSSCARPLEIALSGGATSWIVWLGPDNETILGTRIVAGTVIDASPIVIARSSAGTCGAFSMLSLAARSSDAMVWVRDNEKKQWTAVALRPDGRVVTSVPLPIEYSSIDAVPQGYAVSSIQASPFPMRARTDVMMFDRNLQLLEAVEVRGATPRFATQGDHSVVVVRDDALDDQDDERGTAALALSRWYDDAQGPLVPFAAVDVQYHETRSCREEPSG